MSTADIPATDPDQLPLWNDGASEPARQPDGDRLWSIKDVGHYLDVPVATIYQWRVRGEGPPATRMGKHLRFEPEGMRVWVSKLGQGACWQLSPGILAATAGWPAGATRVAGN